MKVNTLINSVVNKALCAGCGLCVSIAPKDSLVMALNQEGYLRPKELNPAHFDEIIIREVCPGIIIKHDKKVNNYHPLWGSLIQTRVGYAADNTTRHNGSSGGIISALAIYLLEQNKVDYVAQIAVSVDDPLRNELQLSRTKNEVLRAAGSRYSPSAPLEKINELLEMGERFAFIGKPCDVAALRRYALHDSRVNELIPYMISFMCAGIPSIKGTYEILEKLGINREQLKSFRYRGDGWPGMTRAESTDRKIFEMDYNSSWGSVLNKHLQFRCKICPDGTGEFADIVCADAWYGKDGYPDFTERDGRSLIITRTIEGEKLIDAAFSSLYIKTEYLPVNQIELMQPYQANRKKMVLGRLLAVWIAFGKISPRYKKLGLINASLMASPIEWLRNAIGTYKRTKGRKEGKTNE